MKRTETFAIGRDGMVNCWCTGTERRFDVLNGAWVGRIQDGVVYVVDSGAQAGPAGQGDILWRGIVPREFSRHYNDAIPWIQSEVNRVSIARRA